MKQRSKGELHRATLAAVEHFNKSAALKLGLSTVRWDLDRWRVVASEFVPGWDWYMERNHSLEMAAQRGQIGEFRQQ